MYKRNRQNDFSIQIEKLNHPSNLSVRYNPFGIMSINFEIFLLIILLLLFVNK